MDLATYSVVAENHPEHADNLIHTDAGARAAGFPAALVAGVTTYHYLTQPLLDGWGVEWLRTGGGEVRFRRPVLAGDPLRCIPTHQDGGTATIAACVGDDEAPRATLAAVRRASGPSPLRPGEQLRPVTLELRGRYGRTWKDLAHPSVWPSLANHVVHRQVARGSWIHLRSAIRHHATVPSGATVTVTATVVERYERGGERAILDVHVVLGDVVVASLEHEAIVALAG